MRGMLSDISIAATEKEIRSHIDSGRSYACCTENDFEFLEANGRYNYVFQLNLPISLGMEKQ